MVIVCVRLKPCLLRFRCNNLKIGSTVLFLYDIKSELQRSVFIVAYFYKIIIVKA